MKAMTAFIGFLVVGLACEFGSSWLAVDFRHASKVTLAVMAVLCFVGMIGCFFAWLDGED